jgi:hypothetical protein
MPLKGSKNANEWSRVKSTNLSGDSSLAASRPSDLLISECEDDIDEEDDAVDDGEGALGDASGLVILRDESLERTDSRVIPELDDEDSGEDEQDAADDREENVWKAQKVSKSFAEL